MIPGYMTKKEASEKWGMSIRYVNTLCNNGKISGAMKFGTMWAIPADSKKPTIDRRIKTGEYRDWRKKYGRNRNS